MRYIQGNHQKTVSKFFSRNSPGQKGVARHIQDVERKHFQTRTLSKIVIQSLKTKLSRLAKTKPALQELRQLS